MIIEDTEIQENLILSEESEISQNIIEAMTYDSQINYFQIKNY